MSRVTTQEAVIAKQLPHSAESERGLLGAVIMDNLALDEMGSLIDGDFFFESHRTVFRLMRQMAERRELIDLVTLNDKLQATDELVSVGGAAYLGKLIDGVPKISNISHYVKLVRDKAVLRSAIHAANHIQDLAFEGAGSAESVLDHAAQKFLDLAMQVSSMDSFGKSYRDAAAALLDSFDNRKWRPVMTGLELLDRATGGFFPGELVTVTAGTGVGKTFFAQQIRRHSCGLGLHSLYASGEMEAEHLVSREIATEASVEHWKMRRPERLSDSDRSALLTAAAHECIKCSILDGELSLQSIRVAARRKKKATGLHLLEVDYDELVDAPGKNELEQQRNLIRGSKSIGVSLGIPVVMISQLRKPPDAKEDKQPTLQRIYGSGAKSKHSSWILFIEREYVRDLEGDETEAMLYILKARDGRINKIALKFNLQTLRFDNAPPPVELPTGRAAGRKKAKKGGEE